MAPFLLPNNNSLYLKMKKLLFIALFIIATISCDKDDDNNTSIVGKWTVAEHVDFFSTVGSVFVPGFPPFTNDTTILYDTSSTEVQTTADLDSLEIEFLTDESTAIFFDNFGSVNSSYSYSNNILELVIPEGADNGSDSTFIIPVSNLTSNSADLLLYNLSEREIETDSSTGIISDFTTTITVTWKLIK